MHSLVEVEALVLGSRPRGEADRYITLLTRERGLIQVRSIGVRKENSKLRYVIQDFAHLRCYLVSGKAEWRLTNAILLKHFYPDLSENKSIQSAARISSLVSRLVHGEIEHINECSELFSIVESAWSLLSGDKDLQSHDALEVLAALKILKTLGYLPESSSLPIVSDDPTLTFELVRAINPIRREAIETINKALRESHL